MSRSHAPRDPQRRRVLRFLSLAGLTSLGASAPAMGRAKPDSARGGAAPAPAAPGGAPAAETPPDFAGFKSWKQFGDASPTTPIPYGGPTTFPADEIRAYEQAFRRHRQQRVYGFKDLRIADCSANGLCLVDQGEGLFAGGDSQPRPPMIRVHAETGAALEGNTAVIADASECFLPGVEPFGWTTDLAQSLWSLPCYYRVHLIPPALFRGSQSTAAGTYIGFGVCRFLRDAGATANVNHLGLRFNLNTNGWEAVINNRHGPSGHRTFVRALGDGAGGSHVWGQLVPFRLEILYVPGVKVSFFLSGGEATTMKDTDVGIAPYTPLADMKNKASRGSGDDRGIVLYTTIGANSPSKQSEGLFWWPHVEIDAPPNFYPYHS